ncbi:hypothetical protein [Aeromonas simiae]|uniref:Uncharacterized protein n=1 Tax=Aeromonas simiae TaxID=218936 RepID=A0A5J6X0P3_9GAMM|nr:hypothetical protein [Aeromonas simiae]MDO2949584.1 hypothetical protein [Aeromonas simiae]MDO2953238.1 hypothetical protein [Aeromonas simiae]MDO2956915.1 hypothetical protein [Aeromonas simiae]QFI56134.1 hypothetical protein FE240_16505 [Aeromonas simiae]
MLLFLWRASLLYMFPLIIFTYGRLADVSFEAIDSGVNSHKWVIIGAYLAYSIIWLLANRYLEQLLRRRGRR